MNQLSLTLIVLIWFFGSRCYFIFCSIFEVSYQDGNDFIEVKVYFIIEIFLGYGLVVVYYNFENFIELEEEKILGEDIVRSWVTREEIEKDLI